MGLPRQPIRLSVALRPSDAWAATMLRLPRSPCGERCEALQLNDRRVSRRNASRSPVLEFWPGTCQESAVDGKCVSGDPGSVGGSKEGDRGSDVLRFPDPSERVDGGSGRLLQFRVLIVAGATVFTRMSSAARLAARLIVGH